MMNAPLNRLIALSTIAILGLNSSLVQAHPQPNYRYSGWSWSGNIDHISIDPAVANRYDIQLGETATAIGIAAEYFRDDSDMTYSLGLSYIMYNDNNEFYQYVHDSWNGNSYEQSDANAFMAFAEAGQKIRFGFDHMNFFTARGGVSGIFGSSRSIAYCSDCYSEHLDINGGLYGVVGIGHSFDSVDVELQFQQYFSGDLDNTLRLKISSSF